MTKRQERVPETTTVPRLQEAVRVSGLRKLRKRLDRLTPEALDALTEELRAQANRP